ncbi:DPOLM polymerase, partial [Amia calva]|nr:DPOLM polymerase [Amia calva]
MMVPLKRRKRDVSGETHDAIKYPHVVIFLLERRMGSSRRAFLTRLGRSKGFHVEESFSTVVTHVVSEGNSGGEVQEWLDTQAPRRQTHRPLHLLDISWFTDSMGASRPVDIEDRHMLEVPTLPICDAREQTVSPYACQRRTPLQHHNSILIDALEVLAENAQFHESEGRSLAFWKAGSVLKALPLDVQSMEDLRGVPCLGEHSQRVIKEILEYGVSREVKAVLESERYQVLKVLTSVFGVGVKTADRWFREGVRTPGELVTSGRRLTREQEAGVRHYKHLSIPVTRAEARAIERIVKEAVLAVLPGVQLTLTGGFRRGKQTGHDVDFLITHPEEGKEEGLLPKVISWLESQDLLLYNKMNNNSYGEAKELHSRPVSSMDRFERCFSIFRLDQPASGTQQPGVSSAGEAQGSAPLGGQGACEPRGWKAVRVDLVVTPISQFAFALLGWTGSQHFERELRRWAGQEKQMSLNSHALFDRRQKKFLPASSEEEIFTHLGLDYIPPSERNA